MTLTPERGTLKDGEPHPMARSALAYVAAYLSQTENPFLLREAIASCALEGNRTAEICGETLERLLDHRPVSDRYLLGLAWFIKTMEDEKC
jgi:hypothetical protein